MKSITPIFHIVLLCASVLLPGCNDDIFVDKIPGFEDSSVTLDGNGGSYVLSFQPKSALSIKFDNSFDYFTYTENYSADGERLGTDAPIADIAKIVYGSPRFTVEARIDGDKITIVALDNTYSDDLNLWLTIDYGYMARSLDVTVTPGKPMQIDYIYCDMERASSRFGTARLTPIRITNNSGSDMAMDIYPFKELHSNVSLSNEEIWTTGISGISPIPYFYNDGWVSDDTNKVEITLGQQAYYYSEYTDLEAVERVEVPPHTTVTVDVTLTMAMFEARYLTTVTQPNSGHSWMIDGVCEVSQPFGYSVEIR